VSSRNARQQNRKYIDVHEDMRTDVTTKSPKYRYAEVFTRHFRQNEYIDKEAV